MVEPLKFHLVVVNNNVEDSINNLYPCPRDVDERGKYDALRNIFHFLIKNEVWEAKLTVEFQERPQSIVETVVVSGLILIRDGWYTFQPTEGFYLLQEFATYAWTEMEGHLVRTETPPYFDGEWLEEGWECILCKKRSSGKFRGYTNPDGLSREPIYTEPSICLNPDCLSHNLDELANPSYKAPRAELKEEASARGKKKEEIAKKFLSQVKKDE